MISDATGRWLVTSASLCSLIFTLHVAHGDEQTETVLAVIPAQRGVFQPSGAVVAELETALFQDKGFVLVERQQIARILNEHALALSGLGQTTNRLSIGRWLTADVILFIDSQPSAQNPVCQLSMVEARTGIALDAWVCEQQALLKDIPAAIKWIERAGAKRLVPIKDRHLLSVLSLRSEEGGTYLDNTVDALNALIQVSLGQMNEVALLEREHVEHLRTEKDLSTIDMEMRSAVLLLDGSVRRTPNLNELAVTLRLQGLGGNNPATANIVVSSTNMPGARTAMLNALRPLLKLQGGVPATNDPKGEADFFARQSKLWSAWGDPEKALTAASAAFALDVSQRNRVRLADLILRGAKDIDDEISSYQLYEDYIDTKFRDLKAGLDRDLIFEMPYRHGRVWFTNGEPDKTKRQKQELMEKEDRMFRRVILHYREHFDELWSQTTSDDPRNPYWGLWAAGVRNMRGDYYPWSSQKQVDLVREAVEAFANPPSTNQMRMPTQRLDILLGLGINNLFLPAEEQRSAADAMKELQKHKDPLVRTAAHKVMLDWYSDRTNAEHREAARVERKAIWEILLNDVPPEHPYRSYWYSEKALIMRYIEPMTGELNEEGVEDYGDCFVKFIEQSVNAEQSGHLEALNQTAPKWLKALAKFGRTAEADALAEQIINRVKSPDTQQHGWAAGLVQTLLQFREEHAATLDRTITTEPNDLLWNEFDITEVDLGLDERIPDMVIPDGTKIHCLYAWYDATIRLTTHELPSGAPLRSMSLRLLRSAQEVRAFALDRHTVYVGTSDGLAVFSLADGKAFFVTERDGLPGNSMTCVGCYEGMVYLAFRDPRHILARYDPSSKRSTILASEAATEKRNPLDGIAIDYAGLLPDHKRKCLWIAGSTNEPTGRTSARISYHLWSYDPTTDTFMDRKDLVVGYGLAAAASCGMLGAAMDRDYLVEWPNLVQIDNRSSVALPAKDKKTGEPVSFTGLVWEGDRFLLSGRLTDRGVLAVGAPGSDTFSPLRQFPGGKRFPPVKLIQKTDAGTLALCTDGSAYLVRRRESQVKTPVP